MKHAARLEGTHVVGDRAAFGRADPAVAPSAGR